MSNQTNMTPLTVAGAMELTGYSRSYLYQLARARRIKSYKPDGAKQGKLFFCKEELTAYIFSNPKATTAELHEKAESLLVGGVV